MKTKRGLALVIILMLVGLVRNAPYVVPPLSPHHYGFPLEEEDWVPRGYYHSPSIIPADMSLEEWLSLASWGVEYEANAFDCSQMSAFLEWGISNAGYDVHLFTGYNHCWLSIKTEQGWVSYDAVHLEWAFQDQSDARYYQPEAAYHNLHHVAKRYHDSAYASYYSMEYLRVAFEGEFVWWTWTFSEEE